MNCSPPTTMALAHTHLIDGYDRNRDIAALSDNGLEYGNCKAERTASLVWPEGAKTFRMRLYDIGAFIGQVHF
jgi:hypothetical protein